MNRQPYVEPATLRKIVSALATATKASASTAITISKINEGENVKREKNEKQEIHH